MLTVNSLLDDTFASVGYKSPELEQFKFSVSLSDFSTAMYRGYVHTGYQSYIDGYLEQVAEYVRTGGERGIGRLLLFAPPRHGKSLKVSRLFPAWLFGNLPNTRVIMSSYAVALAKTHSRFVRNLIDSDRYHEFFPSVRIASDTAASTQWDIAEYGGGVIAAGVGGGITGHGAKLAIIDDPIKGRAEAESEVYRERVHDWYSDDLLTRLEEPGGAIVIMHTRWHTDDLAGWILNGEDAAEWTVVNLPALAEENDPLGRQPGQALWPERYDEEKLNKRRARMGEYSFMSLYQQKPLLSTGGLFDIEKIGIIDIKAVPECVQVVRFYDLAVTAKRSADYTAGVLLGVTADEQFIILDVWRGQKEFPDVREAIVQNATIDGAKTRIRLEAEKAGIIGLQELLRDPRMRAFSVDAVPPEGDKYSRALPVASRVNGGRVKLVRGAWNRAFLDELSVFGANAAHDDQVDALSGAYGMLIEPPQRAAVW